MRCCSDRQFDLLERIRLDTSLSVKGLTPGQRKTADWLEEKKKDDSSNRISNLWNSNIDGLWSSGLDNAETLVSG